jgi:hypothetical protein
MAEETDKSNWTIKNFPVAVRKDALEGANRQNENAATWLARAVENQANMERGAVVFPPGQPVKPTANPDDDAERLADRDHRLVHRGQLNYEGLAQAMQAAVAGCAAAGIDMPKPLARAFVALIGSEVRAARGLPPVKRRGRKDVARIEG